MDMFYLAFMIVFSVLEIELIKNIFGEVSKAYENTDVYGIFLFVWF